VVWSTLGSVGPGGRESAADRSGGRSAAEVVLRPARPDQLPDVLALLEEASAWLHGKGIATLTWSDPLWVDFGAELTR